MFFKDYQLKDQTSKKNYYNHDKIIGKKNKKIS